MRVCMCVTRPGRAKQSRARRCSRTGEDGSEGVGDRIVRQREEKESRTEGVRGTADDGK
jgi:hypothetical protein